ncbi:MAG TPA: hypothetical protein PKK23_16205 [Nitrospirales bacterium]|nr:hypothetical protein [Nitrospirales bacterium]
MGKRTPRNEAQAFMAKVAWAAVRCEPPKTKPVEQFDVHLN